MYKEFFNKSNLHVTFILDPFVCVCILYNLLRLEREFHIQTFMCKSLISNCKKNSQHVHERQKIQNPPFLQLLVPLFHWLPWVFVLNYVLHPILLKLIPLREGAWVIRYIYLVVLNQQLPRHHFGWILLKENKNHWALCYN